jgi:hypothetical protein
MTKTKPETRKEAANSVTSLASSAPKRGKTLWVEMSIYPTERKGSFKLVNERALDKHGFKPVLGGYVSKMVLEHLRAAQDTFILVEDKKRREKWINEGMAQGALKTLDELEKRNIELAKRYEKAKGKAKKSITGEEMEMVSNANFIGALRELNAVNYWIAAKRKEAQKQEGMK